MNVVIIFGN